MKSHNKKIVIIIIHFLSLSNSYAQNEINQLFFNLPLQSSRDTIYSSIKKYGFIEKHSNRNVSQNDQIIKTFYGSLDRKSSEKAILAVDSIKIQLSIGSTSSEIDKYYQNLLVVWSYYHFSDPRAAKLFYRDKKIEIDKITAAKQLYQKNFGDHTKTGVSDKFMDDQNERVSISFKRERPGYIVVVLEYERNEGEKKLKHEFMPKKELVFRKIDIKNVFLSNNVEQIPLTKKCAIKNDRSIECFKESIANHISYDVDFDSFYLTPERRRIAINFIITKNNEIINIKVSHPNKKLCEEVMNSINEINIIGPAINKGIKVDYLVDVQMSISNVN
ncbi:hypothetical protein GKZ90_0005820 [Flavobacterium sp. MC2016-06]|jgi:hypothetical protein|uniref:hypothetical protein n=1 Tax=Flavobacterium sp. MC2016-06 TaxID=2676308 RepID=UPI0012BA9B96|nr:hypothetical protein [Flavobacterium sp. MC2016-06]MBU3857655.1 hypothetical protein [Flavobacterium sp. MC2016-06]